MVPTCGVPIAKRLKRIEESNHIDDKLWGWIDEKSNVLSSLSCSYTLLYDISGAWPLSPQWTSRSWLDLFILCFVNGTKSP